MSVESTPPGAPWQPLFQVTVQGPAFGHTTHVPVSDQGTVLDVLPGWTTPDR